MAVDLSYPLVVNTLGKMRALGMSLSVSCHTYLCHKHTWLDMDDLIARLGEDHPCMHTEILIEWERGAEWTASCTTECPTPHE